MRLGANVQPSAHQETEVIIKSIEVLSFGRDSEKPEHYASEWGNSSPRKANLRTKMKRVNASGDVCCDWSLGEWVSVADQAGIKMPAEICCDAEPSSEVSRGCDIKAVFVYVRWRCVWYVGGDVRVEK